MKIYKNNLKPLVIMKGIVVTSSPQTRTGSVLNAWPSKDLAPSLDLLWGSDPMKLQLVASFSSVHMDRPPRRVGPQAPRGQLIEEPLGRSQVAHAEAAAEQRVDEPQVRLGLIKPRGVAFGGSFRPASARATSQTQAARGFTECACKVKSPST